MHSSMEHLHNAIDYFSHIYPHTHINRIFAVAYLPVVVTALLFLVFFGRQCDARVRINLGLALSVLSLLLMHLLEVFYIRGRIGLFSGFYVSPGAVVMCGAAEALVQSGVVGSAGELPERYMQAVVSGYTGSGYVTEDVCSEILKDWYPITLITGYYLFDLLGKSLASLYVIKSSKITVGLCIGRVVFYPLFVGCLHGPQFLRTEIPVAILTCFLGLTNGYLTAVAMISAPKLVPFQHAEVAGILMAMFLVLGLAIGSLLVWFWVI